MEQTKNTENVRILQIRADEPLLLVEANNTRQLIPCTTAVWNFLIKTELPRNASITISNGVICMAKLEKTTSQKACPKAPVEARAMLFKLAVQNANQQKLRLSNEIVQQEVIENYKSLLNIYNEAVMEEKN